MVMVLARFWSIVLYCIVLGVALTRPLYSTGGVIVQCYQLMICFRLWNGNFQDLQIDVEISEISENNLWKFPKFPNVRAFYMGDFRFSAKSRDFRWYQAFSNGNFHN